MVLIAGTILSTHGGSSSSCLITGGYKSWDDCFSTVENLEIAENWYFNQNVIHSYFF